MPGVGGGLAKDARREDVAEVRAGAEAPEGRAANGGPRGCVGGARARAGEGRGRVEENHAAGGASDVHFDARGFGPAGTARVGGGGRTRGRARGGGGDDDDEGNHRTTRSGEGRAVDERGRSLEARTRRRLELARGGDVLGEVAETRRARAASRAAEDREETAREDRGERMWRVRGRAAHGVRVGGEPPRVGEPFHLGAPTQSETVSTLARVSRPPVHLYEYQYPEKEIAKNRDYAATWKRYLADAFDSAFFYSRRANMLDFVGQELMPGVVASVAGALGVAHVEGRLGGGG